MPLLLSPGQAGDHPLRAPVSTEHRLDDRGPFRLLADKASSQPSTCRLLRALTIPHTIPERTDQITRRQATGARGGRPPDCDADLDKERNTVERGFARLKLWRGIASRDDKYALTYLATIVLNHRIRI